MNASQHNGLRAAVLAHLGDATPAMDSLVTDLAEAVADLRNHAHPKGKGEDLFCGNLTAWMGERMAPVLRRLLDAEAEAERLRARAGEKDTLAGESTPAPKTADRRAYLLDRIRSGRGQWTPGRVKRLYQRLGLTHVYRATIRADLAALCRDGHLVLHDGSDRRYYTLKDGA